MFLMPRTVPAIDGTPNRKDVSVSWVDANNKKRSDTWYLDSTSTDAEIEAAIAAAAVISNANIWRVKVTQVYEDVPNSGDALDVARNSVMDNVVMLFKNATIAAGRDYFIPAPIEALFLPATNLIDSTNTDLIDFRDALDAMLVNFEPVSVRFSERRKKNPSRSI